jgi:hypothetical protein
MAPYFRFSVPCAITTTTTTTTTTAPPCYCFGAFISDGGSTSTIEYSRCSDGALIQVGVTAPNTRYVCSRGTPTYVSGASTSIFQCTTPGSCSANAECIGCG